MSDAASPEETGSQRAPSRRPALLVSLHDVSPLTIDDSRRMLDMAIECGVPIAALTLLVIPRHEDRAPLDEHEETLDWLRRLAEQGATLCLHGHTHVMSGRPRGPWQWAWARGFAQGQAELYVVGAAECRQRLEAARLVLRRAGLEHHVEGFVPPAWLLSAGARAVVQEVGFAFHEGLGGLHVGPQRLARRLVGFGSLGPVERRATALHARLQTLRPPADTRLAIHPVDMRRPDSRETVRRTMVRLLARLTPMSYHAFLRSRSQATAWQRPDSLDAARPER